MRTAIAMWGNSLALRLPKGLAEDARLIDGTCVSIHLEAGNLVVIPDRPRYRLEELLTKTTPETTHREIDWGEPVGKEIL